jgi:hypothetical protein
MFGKKLNPTGKQKIKSISILSAKMFDEKGHQSMTVSFYLTGQERSGVVAVKVQKVYIDFLFNFNSSFS